MWFSSNKHVVTVKVWINWCVCLNNTIKQYETLLSYEALRVADCVYPAHCWLKKKLLPMLWKVMITDPLISSQSLCLRSDNRIIYQSTVLENETRGGRVVILNWLNAFKSYYSILEWYNLPKHFPFSNWLFMKSLPKQWFQ